MATTTIIKITHDKTRDNLTEKLTPASPNRKEFAQKVANFFEAMAVGAEQGTVEIYVGDTLHVAASATATLVDVGATDSITINGVEFAAVASGATGNQWNIGADDDADAAALAAKINASTTAKIAGYVTATAAANVVTITALEKGKAGNMFTLTDTGSTITVTGSGFLASGVGGGNGYTTFSVNG